MATSQSLCAVIVDDNHDAAAMLAAVLDGMGCQSVFVTDPRNALHAIALSKPKVVFLDIGMPHLNGHELARLIRLHYPGEGLLIVGISGYATFLKHQREAVESGFDELLPKPTEVRRLQEIVNRVLQ